MRWANSVCGYRLFRPNGEIPDPWPGVEPLVFMDHHEYVPQMGRVIWFQT
jgi:hypothetical protein